MSDYDVWAKVSDTLREMDVYDFSGDRFYGQDAAREFIAELELQGLKIVERDENGGVS